jgi:hypothetical protein
LATAVASVQEIGEPVLSTDEVRPPTQGEELVVQMVGVPMLEATQAPREITQERLDTERETVLVSQPSSPVSTGATVVVAGGVPAGTQVPSTREDANEIMMMLEQMMVKVCERSERIEAQTSATAERDMQVWKRRLVICEEALKGKVAVLTEVEKEQVVFRPVMEAKDAELAKVWVELEAERRAHTNVEQLRSQLKDVEADVMSFKRQLGILKGDVEEARQEAWRMYHAFQILEEEQRRRKAEWKRIQTRLTADVESTTEENGQLKQAVECVTAETTKQKNDRDSAVRRAWQFQEGLGPVKMELSVALKDLRKAQSISNQRQKEIDRLQDELGKKAYLAQANLKRIVEKVREKTNAEIQVAIATAL